MDKLIVLDLDETLFHTEVNKDGDYFDQSNYDFKFQLEEYFYFVRKRPYQKEFLDYVFENFKVGIWTAASEDYAKIAAKGCNIDESKLLFFWDREKCTTRISYTDDGRYYGLKPLSKVKKSFNYKLENILVIDDIFQTAEDNYGNLIRMTPFTYQKDDNELFKLISYLEKIKNSPDFRKIEKRGWLNHNL